MFDLEKFNENKKLVNENLINDMKKKMYKKSLKKKLNKNQRLKMHTDTDDNG